MLVKIICSELKFSQSLPQSVLRLTAQLRSVVVFWGLWCRRTPSTGAINSTAYVAYSEECISNIRCQNQNQRTTFLETKIVPAPVGTVCRVDNGWCVSPLIFLSGTQKV